MKKKTLITFILIVFGVLVLGTFSVSAATFGELTYSTLPNGTIGITGYNEYATDDIVIPSEIYGKSVTYIDQSAFMGNTTLTSISIPNTVTGIGDYAFADCWRLTSINIPNSVTRIGKHAFYGSGLTSVSISNRITNISDFAFSNTELRSVIIPNSVTSIGEYAFSESSLESVIIPDNVTSIGEYAFSECKSLNSATISNSVTGIEDFVFSGCSRLTCVIIPDNVSSIGNATFSSCTGLTSILIPENITSIGDYAFNNCSNIKTVFYAGSESQWNEISFHNNNENLTNAHIINVTKQTYKFETNCDSILSEVTTYCLFDMPKPYNEKQVLIGWYDNAALSGDAIVFPYYGNTTTLYAAWAERTGTSFDDAFYLKESKTSTTHVDAWDYVYYEFVPQFSGQYRFYAISSGNVYINLYNQNKNYIGYTNNGEYLSYDYFEAGNVYYLSIRSYKTAEISLTIETDMTIGTSSKVSQDGKTFTVTGNGIPYGKTVILALYDGNKFVGMQSATYIGNEIYFTTTESYTNAKVMVWDSLTNLKLVCSPEIVE